ncbi:MAG: DUF6259 domain-containing protein [Candidatus Latescibacterota bacterium]
MKRNHVFILCTLIFPLFAFSVKAAENLILENTFLKLEFNADSGALSSMVNKKSGSEYINRASGYPPFVLDVTPANRSWFIKDYSLGEFGGFSLANPESIGLVPGDIQRIRNGSITAGKITSASSGKTLTCTYNIPPSISVITTVTIRDDSPVTIWKIRVRNDPSKQPKEDLRLFRVAFPVIEGLALGKNHADDFLARPFVQGQLIPDPASYSFFTPTNWAKRDNVLTYIGWACMPWQDLYDSGGGLYLASYDPTFQQIDLETFPDKGKESITMDIRTLAPLYPGQSWESQEFAVAVHDGDWHWAADTYREKSSVLLKPVPKPEWVREADGWFGTGVPNYKYEDLPAMYEQAQWLGLNYLQIWSEMLEPVDENGKRKGYYCFFIPDAARGGEQGMREGVRKVRAAGGHIGFYSNAWTFDATLPASLLKYHEQIPSDVKLPDWWKEFRAHSSVYPDGTREAGNYLDGYAGMCVGAEGWQDYLKYWIVDKYVRDYGVDTWYVDSFPVTMFGAARVCFSTEHGSERPHGVGRGCLELLRKLKEGSSGTVNLAITSETVSDALTQYQSHALGLELVGDLMNYPKPEIFAYTFPEFPIFSGTCDNYFGVKDYYPGEKTKFTHEDSLNRVFLIGNRFDVIGYPLQKDSSYWLHVKKLIALRQAIKSELLSSHFKDDIGLESLPSKVEAKIFRNTGGKSLTITLLDRRDKKEPFTLTVDSLKLGVKPLRTAVLYTFDGEKTISLKKAAGGKLILALPARKDNPAAIIIR